MEQGKRIKKSENQSREDKDPVRPHTARVLVLQYCLLAALTPKAHSHLRNAIKYSSFLSTKGTSFHLVSTLNWV